MESGLLVNHQNRIRVRAEWKIDVNKDLSLDDREKGRNVEQTHKLRSAPLPQLSFNSAALVLGVPRRRARGRRDARRGESGHGVVWGRLAYQKAGAGKESMILESIHRARCKKDAGVVNARARDRLDEMIWVVLVMNPAIVLRKLRVGGTPLMEIRMLAAISKTD
jgi:hypothetical protein